MPARADAQFPASIASNTPRQSFGAATDAEWLTTIGCCDCTEVGALV
jgi:hypothetical protein